jgi:hypothetical protein
VLLSGDSKAEGLGATPMGNDQQNLYEVLGLSQDADRDLIEQQCVRLGDRYRSDKNSGDLRAALMFAQIEKAYQTLVDPVRRAAYDAELRGEATAQGHAAAIGTVRRKSPPASGAASSGEDISLHSKINSWVALLFLLSVFKVLSDLLSKLAAKWLQTNNFDALNVAFVGAIAGVIAAFVGTVMFGRFLAEIIPLRPPLSGILRTRGATEITPGKRVLATVAMLVLTPVVLVGGFIAVNSLKKESAGIAAETSEIKKKESAGIAAEAEEKFHSIHGIGARECGEYLSYRQKENNSYDGATARINEEWALGFVTGYNSATSTQLASNIPGTTVIAFLDKYCRDEPLRHVANAVSCLHASFGGPPLPYCK